MSGALAKIEERSPYIQPMPTDKRISVNEENQTKFISATRPITSTYLLNYLESRCIDIGLAQQQFYQARYENKGHAFLAIGFKNDLGGFELRSPHFKGSSSPKAVTFIDQGCAELKVIEGSFSYASLRQLQNEPQASNFLVLNSLSLLKSSIPIMLKHERVSLYLDADKSGRKATTLLTEPNDRMPANLQKDKLLEMLETGDYKRFTGESKIFAPHKDPNEHLMAMNGKMAKGKDIDKNTKGLEPL